MDNIERLRKYLDDTFSPDGDIVYVSIGGRLVFIPKDRNESVAIFHLTEC